ncbi:MAG: hypothetical protein Q7K39_00805 [Candidatus Magasanikbacteria bacterium]|nr:hypothetical protein [Candidatus Magasanikbacteria bacterium]
MNRFRLYFLGASLLVTLGAGCIQFGGSKTALGPSGMYRSSDKGETWAPIVSLPTAEGVKSMAGVNVFRVFTDPGDANAMYLASRNQGLFFTYNNGSSWSRSDVLAGKYIYAMAIDPQNKCVIYVSDEGHIYKTSDCTRSWRLIYTEERPSQRPVSLAIDYADSNLIYAALAGGDILKSVDGGTSWRVTKRFGFPVQYLTADPFAAKRIYVAAAQKGLFRSDNAGEEWYDMSGNIAGYSGALNFYRLILHPSKKANLFWISKYGILHSEDGGATWKDLQLITPPGGVNIYAFAVNPQNDKEMYYTGTILNEKGVPVRSTLYKTVDGGKTWVTKKLPTNTIPVYLYVHVKDGKVIFLGFTAST